MANELEIVISARDQASKVVDQAGRQIQQSMQAVNQAATQGSRELVALERSTVASATGFRSMARDVRLLADPLVYSLSPALAGTVADLTQVARSAALTSSALGAIAIVGVGALAVGLGTLIAKWRESAQAKREWDQAMQTGAIADTTRELGKLTDRIEELAKWRDWMPFLFGGLHSQEAAVGAATEKAIRIRAREQGQQLSDALREDYEAAAKIILGQQAGRGVQRFTLGQEGRGLFDFLLEPIEAEFRQAMRAAADLRRQGFDQEAEAREVAARRRRDFRFAGEVLPRQFAGQLETMGAEAVLVPPTAEERLRIFEATEREHALGVKALEEQLRSASSEMGAEATPVGPTPEERLEIFEQGVKVRQEMAALERDRVAILREQEGLTSQERLTLDLLLVDRERLLKVEQAGGDALKEANAELEATVRSSARIRQEWERGDFFAGIAKGFRDVGEEMNEWGRAGQQVVRDFAINAQRYFSDLLFVPIEKGWKKALEEVPRQLAMSTFRILTDLFGRMATAQLFRGLGFSGLAGALMIGGSVMPAAAGPLQVGQLVQTAAGPGIVTPAGGIQLVQNAGAAASGGFNVASLPIPSPSLFTSGGISIFDAAAAFSAAGWRGAAALSSGLAVMSGGQFISSASELAMLGVAAPGVAGAPATAGTWLAAAAPFLSGAAGALGLGLTMFSALQGSPTATNITMSGVSGAMSGALLGSAIFPGAGTLVGAIAGSVLGAGAGFLGKGGKAAKPSAMQRSASEGAAGASALSSAIAGAQSLEELVSILNRSWSPYRQVRVAARGPVAPGKNFLQPSVFVDPGEWGPLDEIRDFTVADLLNPDLQWEVASGPLGVVNFNSQLTQQLRDKIAQLAATAEQAMQAEAQGMFAFEEAVLGGGITRRTFLPTSRTGLVQGAGQQIMVSRSVLEQLLADPDMVERVLRKLVEIDRDRDLGFLTTEEFGLA